MKRILTSEGTKCPMCMGRGIHGAVLRGAVAVPSVCRTCDGYGRMRKEFSYDENTMTLVTLGPKLTVEEILNDSA